MLNGKPLNFRGFGTHEDSLDKGFAIDNAQREQQITWAREELGATLMRSHYPLHPYYYERARRARHAGLGRGPRLLGQDQVPQAARGAAARGRELESASGPTSTTRRSSSGRSGNELSARPGPVQGYYIQRAVDSPSRWTPPARSAYAVAGYPSAGCQPEYAQLDVLGINEYFGWYSGPNGQIADQTTLSDYLDSVRQCYPNKAIVITETGAEANRDGPVEERGTYQFQQAS